MHLGSELQHSIYYVLQLCAGTNANGEFMTTNVQEKIYTEHKCTVRIYTDHQYNESIYNDSNI